MVNSIAVSQKIENRVTAEPRHLISGCLPEACNRHADEACIAVASGVVEIWNQLVSGGIKDRMHTSTKAQSQP